MTLEKRQRGISVDKLLVLVIDSGSGRSLPLIKQLLTGGDLKVQLISANMLRTNDDLNSSDIRYSDFDSKKYLGRSLTLPEIGCASSHNNARSLLAASSNGGVILEDDARICDLNGFETLSKYFLASQKNDTAVLNLSNPDSLTGMFPESCGKDLFYTRRVCPTPLAVGYVVTTMAAKRLIANNNPIQYVSDWPSSGVSFFSAGHGFVHHGDGQTVSTIDPTQVSQRNERSFLKALSILLGIDFLTHMIKFGFNNSYFRKVWWVTFSHKVSFIRGYRHYVK
jgi:GR25 family glycosyltransferase involved in LPS biosynthesis